MQNATCSGTDARQQAGIGRIRNAQDLRNRVGGGTSPDSLARAATPLRIAELRQPRALGSPAPCRKAEPCSSTTVYNINWINWLVIGSGVDPWHYPFRGRPVPFTEA